MTSPYPDPSQINIDAAFSNAESLFAQRRFQEALGIYQNVLSALETRYGPAHPELAYPLQRLGDCFHALSQYRDALPLYQRLLSIGEKILGRSHPDMVNLLIKIARTQEMIGSFQESRKSYETALSLIEGAAGVNHPLYKSTMSAYELILARIDENKKAAVAWRENSRSGPQSAVSPVSGGGSEQIPLPGTPAVPSYGMDMEVSDRQSGADAFESAPAMPAGMPFGGAPPQIPFNQPPQMPPQMPQVPPVPFNSAGPVSEIPSSFSHPSSRMGFEQRRNDPSNDPYLDHLASRVTSLTPPEKLPQDPIKASGVWHGADVMAALEAQSQSQSNSQVKSGSPVLDDDEFDPDYEDEATIEQESEKRSQKLRAARTAVSKSEGVVSLVRSFKEYIVSVVALVVVVGAGYYFFSHTEQKPSSLVSKKIEHTDSLAQAKLVYVTPDNGLRLNLDGISTCTLFRESDGIKVPYNFYDGSPASLAMQMMDSVLERQHWFREIPEGLEDQQGVVLYSGQSPDARVLSEMRRLKGTVLAWYQRNGTFPSELVKIPKGVFSYTNAFSGVKEDMKVVIVRFGQIRGKNLRELLRSGESITGDALKEKGKITGYILMEIKPGASDLQSVAFYLRGMNRHGEYFRSSHSGEFLFLGYKGGVEDGNELIMAEEPRLYRVEKPTKVWISRVPQVPLGLIHHSLPVVLGFLGLFLFLRSLMLAPGQSPDNSTNKTLRLCGWVLIIITMVIVVLQFLLWK